MCWIAPFTVRTALEVFIELSSVFITPKRKARSSNTSSSSVEMSPGEKRWKQSYSPARVSGKANGGDEIMEALNLTEGVNEKLDLILLKLISLDSKMEELNLTVKAMQDKVSIMETEIASVQDRQRTLDGKFSHMEKNAEFVDEQIIELKMALQASTDKSKDEVSECRKRVLYLEAYVQRENLKFEGIPESVEATVQQNATSHEDTKNVLANFMENVLGIEDAKEIEFQRVHRMGKPRMDGSDGRTIIARFLRFPDRERVFKCGRKLKGTNYKMFEDIPKELHELRKQQMDKLRQARKDGRYAFFSKTEPDKLYIDGRYVKL